MKIAPKLFEFSTLATLSGVLLLASNAGAAPSGPSARAAARLKKHPTSAWLAHYLPDDRYKIAGGVWKYVSTDLDTYYHRPDSGLMMSQPAGRVIGFASAAEAEEAGYMPGPGIQMERQRMQQMEMKRALDIRRAMAKSSSSRSSDSSNVGAMLSALNEIKEMEKETRRDGPRNLPALKRRMQRLLVLMDTVKGPPAQIAAKNKVKTGIRSLIQAIDLQMQGKTQAAQQQAALAMSIMASAGR